MLRRSTELVEVIVEEAGLGLGIVHLRGLETEDVAARTVEAEQLLDVMSAFGQELEDLLDQRLLETDHARTGLGDDGGQEASLIDREGVAVTERVPREILADQVDDLPLFHRTPLC